MLSNGTARIVQFLTGPMLARAIAQIVGFCTRHIWPIITAALLLTIACGLYTARHFAINADVAKLISSELPWRQRELAYQAVFTHATELIVAVVDAPTPELAGAATRALTDRLSRQRELFKSV